MMQLDRYAKANRHREGKKERGAKPVFNTAVIKYTCSKNDRPENEYIESKVIFHNLVNLGIKQIAYLPRNKTCF